jgi:hypothetical protein
MALGFQSAIGKDTRTIADEIAHTLTAQFIILCSASHLAEAQRISSLS